MIPYLTRDCKVGDVVRYETVGGVGFTGTLIEWDNATAIVRLDDGTTKAVQC